MKLSLLERGFVSELLQVPRVKNEIFNPGKSYKISMFNPPHNSNMFIYRIS